MPKNVVFVDLHLDRKTEEYLRSRGPSKAVLAAVIAARLPAVLAAVIAAGFRGERPDGGRRPRRVDPSTWSEVQQAAALTGIPAADIMRACVVLESTTAPDRDVPR